MDNYPDDLAPEFDEGGGVITPFEEWWLRVKCAFPHVPENVARYWLHEHWRYSPFEYLPSKNYRFELQHWSSDRIIEILSRLSNFERDSHHCLEHGRHLVENKQWDGKPYKTAAYMLEHGEWPQPIVILDNRDGHMRPEKMEGPVLGAPAGYILIEGHRRFAIGLHLLNTGRMKPTAKLWLMKNTPASGCSPSL